jgi:hypothetical protein
LSDLNYRPIDIKGLLPNIAPDTLEWQAQLSLSSRCGMTMRAVVELTGRANAHPMTSSAQPTFAPTKVTAFTSFNPSFELIVVYRRSTLGACGIPEGRGGPDPIEGAEAMFTLSRSAGLCIALASQAQAFDLTGAWATSADQCSKVFKKGDHEHRRDQTADGCDLGLRPNRTWLLTAFLGRVFLHGQDPQRTSKPSRWKTLAICDQMNCTKERMDRGRKSAYRNTLGWRER